MNSIDTLSGVAFGAFLIAVASQGNASKLIDLAKRDKAFLQWAIALAILMYLYSIPELKGPMSALIATSFFGLALMAGDNIAKQGKIFWDSLGGN